MRLYTLLPDAGSLPALLSAAAQLRQHRVQLGVIRRAEGAGS